MYRQFAFEGDIHASLECVPMAVRRKLDLAQLKISLAGWQSLLRAERLALCHLPVDDERDLTVYREVLRAFAQRAGVGLKPLPLPAGWSAAEVPAEVAARCAAAAVPVDRSAWQRLDEEERYALSKLADPKRDPAKFIAAAVELGLATRALPEAPPSLSCGSAVSAVR